jgi:4'-phosphopantetheinyl transferase
VQEESVPLAVTPVEAPRAGDESPVRGMVDVWSASLEPPAPLEAHLWGCLSPDERERAERFVFPRDRQRFAAGRAFLRLLLAQYLGAEPRSLRFSYGPNGKPALADDRTNLHFNLAHSGPLAVCALARGPELGVDLEQVRPIEDAEAVARSSFSPGEVQRLEALPEPARLRAFYEAWTRKEAFLKALGDGLARPLDSFEVSLGPGEDPRLLRTLGDPEEAERYSLHDLEPETGYLGAIAIPGKSWHVRHVRWRWVEARRTGKWKVRPR